MGDLLAPWIIRILLPGVIKRFTEDLLPVPGKMALD